MKNESKTVIEWLNEAKEQGHEWADAAIENSSVEPDARRTSLSAAIHCAFIWDGTKEGTAYWRDIFYSLNEQGL